MLDPMPGLTSSAERVGKIGVAGAVWVDGIDGGVGGSVTRVLAEEEHVGAARRGLSTAQLPRPDTDIKTLHLQLQEYDIGIGSLVR
jgi:hypothetical protein